MSRHLQEGAHHSVNRAGNPVKARASLPAGAK
jgi:hypothetical protein